MTQSAIDAAIAAAGNTAAANANLPTNAGPQGVVSPAPVSTGKLSLDDLTVGINVDEYIKVKFHGLIVGNHTSKLIDTINVTIDTSAIQVSEVVKYGDPAVYLKTYGENKCEEGGTWTDALIRAQQVDPKARPYKSADIPMVAVEDIVNPKSKKEVLFEAGKTLGYSLSTTNLGAFCSFLEDVRNSDLDGQVVDVEVGFEPRKKNAYEWGIVTFKLLVTE